MGYLAAIAERPAAKIQKKSLKALRYAACVCAYEILKQKTVSSMESHRKIRFLENLLTENFFETQPLKEMALKLKFNLEEAYYILVLHAQYPANGKAAALPIFWPMIENEMDNTVFCGPLREDFVFLLPFAMTKDKGQIVTFIENIESHILHSLPNLLIYTGASLKAAKLCAFAAAYKNACEALEILKLFKKSSKVLFSSELGSLSMFFVNSDKEKMLAFMEEKLGALIESDKKYNGELIKTLESYLNQNNIPGILKDTALSVSGLKYRLNKIKEMGYDLQSKQECFDLNIALRILKITQL